MKFELKEYPVLQEFIFDLPGFQDTFLYDRISNNNYGFWPHLEHFLSNKKSYKNYDSIISRLSITAPLDLEITKAWGKWQRFRSAQSEITSIFLIENYFGGTVLEIVAKQEKSKTPDLRVNLKQKVFYVEVKAQSGQQHGTKHPVCEGSDFYTPQDELDLNSWLFQEKISSRNGRPMKPKVIESEEKGAEVLIAMTDIMPTISEIEDRVQLICPGCKLTERRCFHSYLKDSLVAYFFQVNIPTIMDLTLCKLKEIWLFDECHLDEFMILSEYQSVLLEK